MHIQNSSHTDQIIQVKIALFKIVNNFLLLTSY